MRRIVAAASTVLALGGAASAGEVTSVYTELDPEKDCATFAAAEEGEGDWANMACGGWRGYPVLIFAGDLRDSVFYGFPPGGDLAPAFETFSAFNRTGPTIEWRIETEGATARPFAAIHRWFVNTDPENPDRTTQVLVVSRVGQVEDREGCVVGLVLASGNPQANEQARRIADERARSFDCGVDERDAVGEGLPEFSRSE
jgi:hypothetical protein